MTAGGKAFRSAQGRSRTQRGAALLLAMLTVTLVASLAAAALWQQWRGVEVEAAQRQRVQQHWVLTGALDWARLILQEDLRTNRIDHLSEPWAIPLQEARLSSFLAADASGAGDDNALQAFLSGDISDQQALLNVASLVQGGRISSPARSAFVRLFALLGLPSTEAELLARQWALLASAAPPSTAASADTGSSTTGTSNALSAALAQAGAVGVAVPTAAGAPSSSVQAPEIAADTPLRPQRLEQLVWLGLSPATVQALVPYVTLLPQPTAVNLNTAPPEVLQAVIEGLDAARARQMVTQRNAAHYTSVAQALSGAGVAASDATQALLDVGSRYFLVRGRMRLDDAAVQETSLVERQSDRVRVLWRQRESVSTPTTVAPPGGGQQSLQR